MNQDANNLKRWLEMGGVPAIVLNGVCYGRDTRGREVEVKNREDADNLIDERHRPIRNGDAEINRLTNPLNRAVA